MLEDTERNWKPEQILGRYEHAMRCADERNDEIAKRALQNAFVCAWTRAAYRQFERNNRL